MSATVHTFEAPSDHARVGLCLINSPREHLARLHGLDYDNLHGTGCPSIAQIDRVHDAYQNVGIGKTDLIFGACNHDPSRNNRARVRTAWHLLERWSQATIRLAKGPNGADNALIADISGLLKTGNVTGRFADAVIGSGDHIFAFTVRQLRKAGLRVHIVVANQERLSRDLARAADGCIWLLHSKKCLKHLHQTDEMALAA